MNQISKRARLMLFFGIKEALKIFLRAKTSFILSLLSLSISILLIAASLYSILFSYQIEKNIKEKFIINIFLNDSLSTNYISDIQHKLSYKTYTASLGYVNKEEAAETFIKETGEDFRRVLDYNPLPASLNLKLKSEYVSEDSIRVITKDILTIAGIDDLLFEHETLKKLIETLKRMQMYIFIITIILVLISVYITYSTIKLVISLKHDELETMKLVGATLSTIKMPIIINEIITGFLASSISLIVIKLFLGSSLITSLPFNFQPSNNLLLLLLILGPIISFLVSVMVLRKINLKI
ncbi:MAG: hypothetical protein HXY50_00590 [Ignavibacteriaceae bacterium]|nr:hypothetical protein [Ignavibacteriaceae bacterium]